MYGGMWVCALCKMMMIQEASSTVHIPLLPRFLYINAWADADEPVAGEMKLILNRRTLATNPVPDALSSDNDAVANSVPLAMGTNDGLVVGSSDSESDAFVSADSEAKQTGVLVCGGVRWCMVECRCGHVWWCAVVWVYDLCKVTTAPFRLLSAKPPSQSQVARIGRQ